MKALAMSALLLISAPIFATVAVDSTQEFEYSENILSKSETIQKKCPALIKITDKNGTRKVKTYKFVLNADRTDFSVAKEADKEFTLGTHHVTKISTGMAVKHDDNNFYLVAALHNIERLLTEVWLTRFSIEGDSLKYTPQRGGMAGVCKHSYKRK